MAVAQAAVPVGQTRAADVGTGQPHARPGGEAWEPQKSKVVLSGPTAIDTKPLGKAGPLDRPSAVGNAPLCPVHPLPPVEIRYHGLSVTVTVKGHEEEGAYAAGSLTNDGTAKEPGPQPSDKLAPPPNILRDVSAGARTIAKATLSALGLGAAAPLPKLEILHKISGVLRPGTATLLLAAPGAGSTVFLRTLTGRVQADEDWSLLYNGVTRKELQTGEYAEQDLQTAGSVQMAALPVGDPGQYAGEGSSGAGRVPDQAHDGTPHGQTRSAKRPAPRLHHPAVLTRLAALAPEHDEHEALLTVKETFQFVERMREVHTEYARPAAAKGSRGATAAGGARTAGPARGREGSGQQLLVEDSGQGLAHAADAGRLATVQVAVDDTGVQDTSAALTTEARAPVPGCTCGGTCAPPTALETVKVLRLEEAADTVVGSAMVRGISGGQKRRVTIGEMLLHHAPIVAGDALTSGLDASTAAHIVCHICEWARTCRSTVILALQQPSPEILSCFDEVILLSAGQVLYHGPVDQLEGYLRSLGFVRPSYMDLADFASQIVSDPARAAVLSLDDRGLVETGDATATGAAATGTAGPAAAAGAGVVTGGHAPAAGPGPTTGDASGLLGQEEAGRRPRKRSSASLGAGMTPAAIGQRSASVGTPASGTTGSGWATQHEPDTLPIPSLLSVPELARHWTSSQSFRSMMGQTDVLIESAKVRTGPKHRSRARSRTGTGGTSTAVAIPLVQPSEAIAAGQATSEAAPEVDVNSGLKDIQPLLGGVLLDSPYLQARYGHGRSHFLSAGRVGSSLMARQAKLITRNRVLLMARFLNSAIMGAILATLFINPPTSLFQLRFGLALFSCIFIGFTNNAEVPAALLSRKVVYRHHAAGFYNPAAYVYSLVLCSIPVAVVADLVYGSLVYWPTNFVPDAARFFFFLLVIFLVDLTMASYLRTLAYAMKTQERANAVGTGFIAIWLLAAGFYIIRSQMPAWLAWLVWISPFFWATTSITNNEFRSSRYSSIPPGGGGKTQGQLYMAQYDFPYGLGIQWAGVGFLLGLWAIFTLIVNPLAIAYIRHEYSPGTVRRASDEVGDPESLATIHAVQKRRAGTGAAAGAVAAPMLAAPAMATTRLAAPASPAAAGAPAAPMALAPVTHAAAEPGQVLAAPVAEQAYGQVTGEAPLPAAGLAAAPVMQQLQPQVPVTQPGSGPALAPWSQTALGPGPAEGNVATTAPATGPAVATGVPSSAPAVVAGPGPVSTVSGTGTGSVPDTTPTAAPTTAPAPASGGSVARFPPVTLSFRNVEYDVKLKDGSNRTLLRGVSGFAVPGTLTALMGATGAGKTTLLDVLAARKTAGTVRGQLFLNDTPAVASLLSRVAAYAEQEDIHMPLATVREALEFSAALRYTAYDEAGQPIRDKSLWQRLRTGRGGRSRSRTNTGSADDGRGRGSSAVEAPLLQVAVETVATATAAEPSVAGQPPSQPPAPSGAAPASTTSTSTATATATATAGLRQVLVERVLKVLELEPLSNRLVHSLSRGESKRLTIGVELVSNPSLVFCDEPTTGLDSKQAASVMKVLRRVARTGRTVVCTIHQPSAEIFFAFDRLLLLAPGGYQVYFGPLGRHAGHLVRYLEGIPGVGRMPPATNPGSWMLQVLEGEAGAGRPAGAAGTGAAPGTAAGAGAGRIGIIGRREVFADSGEETAQSLPTAESGQGMAAVAPVPPAAQTTSEQPQEQGSSGADARAPATQQEGLEGERSGMGLGVGSTAGHGGPGRWDTRLHEPAAEGAAGAGAAGGPPTGITGTTGTSGLAVRRAEEAQAAAAEAEAASQAVLTPAQFSEYYQASELCADNTARLDSILKGVGQDGDDGAGTGAAATTTGVTATAAAATVLPPAGEARKRTPSIVALQKGMPRLSPTEKPIVASWPKQLWLVYARANVDYARNTEVFLVRLGVNTFLALLFGLLFVQNDLKTFSGTQSGLGFILGGTAFASIVFMSSGQTLQFERRGVFYRERAARYYAAPAYSLSAFLVELPYTAFITFVFVAVSYWIAGLRANAGAFFFFYFASWMLALFFMGVGIAYVALFPSLPVAQILGGLTISCTFLFAGLFAPASSVPAGWKGMLYAVPTSHVLRALSVNQFYCKGGAAAGCPQITTVGSAGQPVTLDRFGYVTSFLGIKNPQSLSQYPWDEIGFAFAAVAFMVVVGMAALQFVNHQKR